MQKLFCFLGTGKYEKTVYKNESFTYETCYTQEFLYQYYKQIKNKLFDEIVVFVTDESRRINGDLFQEIFADVSVNWVKYDEAFGSEPWMFFELIDEQIADGDNIVFDVTHGFRSVPLITLASSELSLLLKAKANVEAVYYGNYKGRDLPAEFVDLTNVLEVQEWSQAVRSLKRTGNPGLLIEMDNKQKQLYLDQQKRLGKKPSNDILKMYALGNSVEKLTKAIQFCRLHKLESSWTLTEQSLGKIERTESKRAYPYIKIKKEIYSIFKEFDHAETEFDYYSAAIQWCVRYEQYQQAITIMLESVFSTLLSLLNVEIDSRQNRYALSLMIQSELSKRNKFTSEKLLNNTKKELQKSELNEADWTIVRGLITKQIDFFEKTYKTMNDFRNDLNHAGTSKNLMDPKILESFIKEHSLKVIAFEQNLAEEKRR